MQKKDFLEQYVATHFHGLPAILTLRQASKVMGLKLATLRRRFERGSLGVRVISAGGVLSILAADLARYVLDGIPQEQDPIVKRPGRNPWGKVGKPKPGRPPKSLQLARQQ